MRVTVAVLAAAACVAGCSPKQPAGTAAEPPASGAEGPTSDAATAAPTFNRDPAVDAFGYYMPTNDIRVGDLQLAHLGVGTPDEFKDWEAGKRMDAYAPVMLVFDDTSSPMQSNEMGGENRSVQVRVLPTRYAVTANSLSFAGADAKLGAVTFQGGWDMKAVKAAQGGEPAGDAAVLTGKLTAGGKTFDASFTWFGGD